MGQRSFSQSASAGMRMRIPASLVDSRWIAFARWGSSLVHPLGFKAGCGLSGEGVSGWPVKMRLLLLLLVAASAVVRSDASANLGGGVSADWKMQYATGPLLKFQIW